jgi:ParB-like chromosome segregation protein Spo0J
MKVENVLISSLTPDPKNARKHDKGVPELAVSLTTFGQRKPVVVWGNVVIAGNGLVEAAKSLGWTKIEISRVPVDWTYEQAQAFALADNKTAELSEWDTSTLTEIRFDLDSKGWDTDVFGFELLATLVNFGDADPDDVPELPEMPRTKLGDLWALGEHRLLCGDSTEADSYARVMGGGRG